MFDKLRDAITSSFFGSNEWTQIAISEEELLADLTYGRPSANDPARTPSRSEIDRKRDRALMN